MSFYRKIAERTGKGLIMSWTGLFSVAVLAAATTTETEHPTVDAKTCTACHRITPKLTVHSPREIHMLHRGRTLRPENDCGQCHVDVSRVEEEKYSLKADVFSNPSRDACSGCHTLIVKPMWGMKKEVDSKVLQPSHEGFSDEICASCHDEASLRKAHCKEGVSTEVKK